MGADSRLMDSHASVPRPIHSCSSSASKTFLRSTLQSVSSAQPNMGLGGTKVGWQKHTVVLRTLFSVSTEVVFSLFRLHSGKWNSCSLSFFKRIGSSACAYESSHQLVSPSRPCLFLLVLWTRFHCSLHPSSSSLTIYTPVVAIYDAGQEEGIQQPGRGSTAAKCRILALLTVPVPLPRDPSGIPRKVREPP